MEVRRDSLTTFAGSPDQQVVVEPTTSALPLEKTLELAQQSLGEKGYHLSENNCEHFARYCKTGVGISWQVEHSKNGAACGLRWSIKLAAKSPGVAKLLGAALPTALKSWKMTPLMVASDVVEWGTTTLASQRGLAPDRAKRIGRNAGIVTAAVVGTCVAGPVGATAMVGLHVATSKLADRLVGAVTRLG